MPRIRAAGGFVEDGYVNGSAADWRRDNGRTSLSVGNQHSCGQDALINCAKRLGVPVTKKGVYEATLPPEGDTAVGVVVDYARDALNIEMLDTRNPKTLGNSLFRESGGPAHALLQKTAGVYYVELVVSQTGKPDDRHAVCYDADYEKPGDDTCRGAIIDNDANPNRDPIRYINPSDRGFVIEGGAEVPAARKVFDSLFPGASRVRVDGAWACK